VAYDARDRLLAGSLDRLEESGTAEGIALLALIGEPAKRARQLCTKQPKTETVPSTGNSEKAVLMR
jgi:hypothetical protein